MAQQPSQCCNVQNRSPWQVEVRSKSQSNQSFPYNRKADAKAYLKLMTEQGAKAKLVQLETSFQLRVRRKGARVQVITFDTAVQAEQKGENDQRLFELRGLLGAYQPASEAPAVEVSAESLRAALLAHRAAAKGAGKNLLLPKPRPETTQARHGQRQRKPMPKQRKR